MSGDGLSSDSIHCTHKRLVSENTITKFLFRIEPARKYTNADKQMMEGRASSTFRDRKIEDRLREAETEEKLYQDHLKNALGTPIYYGQSVLLKHIYSGKYICLHPNSLARQVGSVRVGFVDLDSELCSMKILPSSRIKKIGDLVSYSDAIVISNSKEDHYYLHASEFLNYYDRGLEINGSETKTEWRPKLYVSDQHDNSLISKSSIVAPGVVVLIHNKHISGYLSVSPLRLAPLCTKREMLTTGGISQQQLNMIPMEFTYMNPVTSVTLVVNVEITSQPSFYAMWEIQKVRLFDSQPVHYYKETNIVGSAIRIRNVATQQYLAIDPNDDSKLVLSVNGHLDECIFYFDSKSEGSHSTLVSTEELLRIKSYKGKFIFPSKSQGSKTNPRNLGITNTANKASIIPGQTSELEFEFRLSDKVDTNSSTFELVSKPKEIIKVLNQLSSIFSNLADFYLYLQDWGMEFIGKSQDSKAGIKKMPLGHFNYDQSFETEKELEIEVRETTKNLEMIYQYLSSEISVRGNLAKYSEMRSVKSSLLEEEFITYDTKKKLLIDLNIIEMLFKISELIFFKTRESLSYFKLEAGAGGTEGLPAIDKKDQKKSMLTLGQLKHLEGDLVEGLPQLIARHRLDSLLMLVFKIMHLAVWDNQDCSNYLALKFDFFQKIIEFFPKEAMDVMREVAKNITNQEDEYSNFYEPWINMLEDISEKQGNIRKQNFILNTLSGLIVDEAINEPIEEFQTKIFNHLFNNQGSKAGQVLFALSSSAGVPEEDENYFQVIFKSANNRGGFFKEQNPSLHNCIATSTHHGSTKTVVNLIPLSNNDIERGDYIYYISAYIKLLTNLCKGRKEAYIAEITSKEVGLDLDYCMAVLQENHSKISPPIKAAIAEFFSTAFLDRFPLRRVSKLDVNCFEFEDIEKLNLMDLPIRWINGDVSIKKLKAKDKVDIQKVTTIMSNLFVETFKKLPETFFTTFKAASINEKNPETTTKNLNVHDENSFIRMRYILESQNNVLSVINEALDLGFLDKTLIRQIMIMAGLLLFSETGEKHDTNKLYLSFMRFITEIKKKDELIPQLKELLFKATQTLKIIAKMRENLQMFLLLKLYRKYETSSKEMKKTMEKIFDILSLNSPIDSKVTSNSLNAILSLQIDSGPNNLFSAGTFQEKRAEHPDESSLDYVQKIDLEVNEYCKPTVSIDLILLKIIFDISRKDLEVYSAARQNNSKYLSDVEYVGGQIDSLKLDQQIRLSILDVITDYYDQRFRILQKLLNVEIIYGEEEKKIYQKLTDNSDSFSLSTENLANHVGILLAADLRYKASSIGDAREEYLSKIRVIIEFLDQLIADMTKKFKTKIDFKKTQNLLKNKGFHEHMLKLLSLRFQEGEHKELFTKLVNFFCLFCHYNSINKKLLAPHITSFIDLIGQGINSAQLVSIIGQAEIDVKASSADIDYIFNKINQIVAADEMQVIFNLRAARKASKFDLTREAIQHSLRMLLSYKIILSGMIFDDKDFRREENQRKIIFYLVNNRDLVKIFEFKYFNEIKFMLAKEGEKSRLDDYYTFYNFYAGYLSLLADASWNFLGGIDQARRVLTKEQLLEVLTSPNTPLYFKKHFLKCFHNIFLCNNDDPRFSSWKTDKKLIEELLGLVIANDLRYASLYYDSLPNLKPKNNQSEEDRTMELKPNSKAKKHIISQNVEETFIRTKEEYWDYLLSSSETEGRSYGLLHFAHYILKCFQTKDIVNQNNEFTNVRMEIRTNLIEILENLIDHEKDDESIDFSDHKRMICECLDILPPEDVRKAGKNVSIQGNAHEMAILNPIDVEEKGKAEQYDGNASDTMMLDRQGEQDRIASQELKKNCEEEFVKHIRRYLVNQRINFEDLFNMLILTNSTDFIKNSKLILGIEDSDRALDFLVAIQVRMQRGDIDLADKEELLREKTTLVDFARLLISLEEEHLIKYKGSGKLVHLKTKFKNQVDDKFKGSKMMASSFKTSDSLRASYQRFVTDYVKIFLENDHYDKELSFWVTKVLEHCDIQKGIEEPLAFLRALQKVFIKSNKKFFLLRTFRQMMDRVYLDFKRSNSNSVVTGETENEKFDQFNAFQNLLDEAEVPVLCLSVINEANDYIMVDEACNILCLLLKEGNSKVQESVFRTFEENIFTQGFFAYFKERLDLGLEEIRGELANPLKDRSILELDHKLLMQRFKILPSQKMIIVLLQVLKYFCDNCFIQFQHFLRMQKTTSLKFNLHSVNMLERISDFLVRITKEMPRDIIFGSLSELVKVILNVLTEFVIGPCVDNQRLMIENRKFLDVVNTIFKIKSEEKSDKETKIASIQIIHQTSIFLESLVTGNEDQRLLGLLLDSLSKKHLKDQLLKIYILKVKSKKNLLFLDKYCSIVSQEDQEDDNKNVDPEKYVARCTKDYCREKKISYFDLMMVNTAFKIFLIIKQLEDRMPNNASLESLGLQKLANRPEFEEIRKKHSIYHLTEFSSKEKKLTNLNLNKIVNIKKANSSKVSALGNRAQKYTDQPIVEDDEDDNDTGKEEDTVYVENLQDEGEFENLGEDKEAILNFAQAIGKLAFNMKGAEDAQMLNEFFKYEKKRYYNEARQFFSSYVASLEINYEGTIQKVHFQIPYCCKFISKSIKRSAIREVNRNSDQERLESFYNKVKHYEFEMKRRQHMSQWRLIYFFIKHWKIINYVNFLLILGINILMVIYFEHSYQASSTSAEDYKVTTVNSMTNRLPQTSFPDTTARVVFNIMTYFQVAMAFIVLIFCAYEQYPIIHYNSSKVDNSLGEREKLKNTKFDDKLQAEVERSELDRRERIRNKTNHTSMVFSSLKDFDNIYNLCLFIISIISMWNYPLLYALLLFDLVKLSKTLSNIFMALLASSKLLVLMLLLSLIVLYFYSVLGFNYFPKDYLHEESQTYKNYCHTLLDCFVSTANNGLRARGGIGEALGSEYKGTFELPENETYWQRVVFDFTFFVVVMILLLNVIFGIIIDAFGNMREHENRLLDDIENKCYICGLAKFELDTKGEGWYRHIYESHNLYNYLYFLIYLEKKDIGDCSGVEKFAKELSQKNDISFFPISRSMSIEARKQPKHPIKFN